MASDPVAVDVGARVVLRDFALPDQPFGILLYSVTVDRSADGVSLLFHAVKSAKTDGVPLGVGDVVGVGGGEYVLMRVVYSSSLWHLTDPEKKDTYQIDLHLLDLLRAQAQREHSEEHMELIRMTRKHLGDADGHE